MRWSPLFLYRDHPSATSSASGPIIDASCMRHWLQHDAGVDHKCGHLNAAAGPLTGDVLMALARPAPRMRSRLLYFMRAPPMEAVSS